MTDAIEKVMGEGDELSAYEMSMIDELEKLADEAVSARWRPNDSEIEISMPPDLAYKFFSVSPRREFLEKEIYRRYTATAVGGFWIGVNLEIVVGRTRASLTLIHKHDYHDEFYANPL